MKQRSISQNRQFICVIFSVLLLFGVFSTVYAEAPLVKTQAPGYYRMMIGQFEITALSDGFLGLDTKMLQNASETEINSLLARMFVGIPKMETALNAYLINTGSKLVLVDAGAAKAFGPTLGNIMQNLKASGYDPAQIDAVVITHMHADHIAGLLDGANKPAFPKALIYVAQAENDFWLSATEAKKAPVHVQKFFQISQDVARPYIASGRWKTFGNDHLFTPGIKAVLIPGHTPGHAAIEVLSNAESLLIIGDMVHSMAVQFSRPDVTFVFDIDSKQAVSTRQVIFKGAAESKTFVAGMHLPFPGVGRIRADGNNIYTWVPVEFSPLP